MDLGRLGLGVPFGLFEPVAGRRVGEYAVTSRIGGGRYGVCFEAVDARGDRVVLKRFRRRMWKRNDGRNHHEAVILSGLNHPAIPELLGVVNDASGYYFVLEYKDGRTLGQWLFDEGRSFTEQDIQRIGTQLLDILVYIHSRSVVHGDISPANVLDDGDRVSLVDFGLARYADADAHAMRQGQFDLDLACFANVMIYLMYSCPRLTRDGGGGRTPWYDDLKISSDQCDCMKRLIGIGSPYADTRSAAEGFRRAFTPWVGRP
ncbi:protein kinase family protein [Bifidobacterium catulorum]|uniref:non-specific serine/threonine protein kinase n=1 Tax=Bifidobacterium catulorum TaxID=1630173 RepID=A0A2U2MV55_9BIFI|nr:protein kinase family protein [Bifidobacterium catulorum]